MRPNRIWGALVLDHGPMVHKNFNKEPFEQTPLEKAGL